MHVEIAPSARRAAAGIVIAACLVLLRGQQAWGAYEALETFGGSHITSAAAGGGEGDVAPSLAVPSSTAVTETTPTPNLSPTPAPEPTPNPTSSPSSSSEAGTPEPSRP